MSFDSISESIVKFSSCLIDYFLPINQRIKTSILAVFRHVVLKKCILFEVKLSLSGFKIVKSNKY